MQKTIDDVLEIPVYRALLESGPDALIAINTDGSILYANSQANRLFGFDDDTLQHKKIETIIPERFRHNHVAHRDSFVSDSKLRPMGSGMDLWAVKKDGTEFPVEVSLSPIETEAGMVVAAAIRDTSVRKKIENALRRAKEDAEHANLTKSRFLAAASHDLRQPLQATQMYLAALEDKIKHGPENDLIQRMQMSTSSLTEILNALLDIARLDTGQVQPNYSEFNIQELMQQVIADVTAHAKEKSLDLRMVETQKYVYSDRGLLGRILGNLLSNAVHHTVTGRILVGCRLDGDYIDVQVWDTGPGIPEHARDSIFEEYFQLGNKERQRNRGLGLGLSIVNRLADLLGHKIDLRSTIDKGSMFSVRVPMVSNPKLKPQIREQLPKFERESKESIKVLFIEDDPDVVDATSLILNLHGYEVYPAGDSEIAYDLISEKNLQPDIILSDYRLPGTETGVQIVQRVREMLKREVPVVFMTGDTSAARIQETNMRFCKVLHKPIEPRKLNSALIEGLISSAEFDA